MSHEPVDFQCAKLSVKYSMKATLFVCEFFSKWENICANGVECFSFVTLGSMVLYLLLV